MSNIKISPLNFPKVSELEIEIVERKGKGHPDTICDALSEELSIALCEQYLDKFGFIMHHNVDKALLVGGKANSQFGGGEMIDPIEIYLTGRAIHEYKGININIDKLVLETAQKWLSKNIPNMNVSKDVDIYGKVKPGSVDLVELFERFQMKGEAPLANDTSFGAGFAPFSETENIVFKLEKLLNSDKFKKEYPYTGEDIKVMGVRIQDKFTFTVAMPFISKLVNDINDYLVKKEFMMKLINSEIRKLTEKKFEVFLNSADDVENESVYITVTGTSAEAGDDGQVGRGNRVNGLITPYRPMSLEAAAGKNPVSHVGKIYNMACMKISERVVKEVDEVDEAYCYLVSRIGRPITEPQGAEIMYRLKQETTSVEEKIKKIMNEEIMMLPNTWKDFLKRSFNLY